jgi:phenylalanyl-tRNA synthetase beta chain
VDSFLEMLGKGGVEYVAEELPSFFHPGQSASLRVGKRALGTIGRLHPRVEKNWDFGQAVYVAEFELENILQKEISQPSYKAFGKFPIVERDFSATVKDVVQAAQIRTLVTKLTRPLFQDLRFFDVYKGSRIPEGHVSYAFRVHLGASDRTLTDQEVNEWQTKVMQAMEQEFGAKFAGM